MKKQYDYLIVGAGLLGATFSYLAKQSGKRCLIIDKRPHTGGNTYCEDVNGIHVHKYGAHIFHTKDKRIWDFVNSIVTFNRYTNSPIANYKGRLYNLPFNMNTFYQMWGVHTPEEAKAKIEGQRKEMEGRVPQNLEEQAISLVGRDIYEILIKGYTEKQWGRKCTELPAFIIRRIPVRLTFDNNYFNDPYQGIPIGGYNILTDKLLEGIEVRLNANYLAHRQELEPLAEKVIYSGAIDEFFDYQLGKLDWRTIHFEHEKLDIPNYQGNAVMNFTDNETPYTRIIEHKHFEFGQQPFTVISREYSREWTEGAEPFYTVNDDRNNQLAAHYKELSIQQKSTIFGGRLAEYKYYDMDQVMSRAFELWENQK
ncbi:MAG: UDP-galactopyranose mutase [Prevotella sp.]|nr:UDP-galactopyranose mutase [Prevotella sp.]